MPREPTCCLLAREGPSADRARAGRSAPACWRRRRSAAARTDASSSGSRSGRHLLRPLRRALGPVGRRTSTSASSARTTAPRRIASSTGRRVASINAEPDVRARPHAGAPTPGEPRDRLHGRHKGRTVRHRRATLAPRCSQRRTPTADPTPTSSGRGSTGIDITGGRRDMWIIDFGVDMPEAEAALYEAPFEYVRAARPARASQNRASAYAERWWLHVEPRPDMRAALAACVALHRHAAHCRSTASSGGSPADPPDQPARRLSPATTTTPSASSIRAPHELWARATGTQLREVESGFRYTPTTTFETFPFPRSHRRAARESRGGRPPPRRAPRRLAQPARPRPRRSREAHAHQPLQPAPDLARPTPTPTSTPPSSPPTAGPPTSPTPKSSSAPRTEPRECYGCW